MGVTSALAARESQSLAENFHFLPLCIVKFWIVNRYRHLDYEIAVRRSLR
jgi:hypothetical protein